MIWLLANGGWLWWVVGATFVVAGPPAVWALTRRRARRAAAALRREQGERATRLEGRSGGTAAFEGVLAAGDPEDEPVADGEVVASTHRAPSPGLHVRLDDGEIHLDLRPFVRAGSAERWPGWTTSASEVVRTLRAGDRVVVHGLLSGEAEAEASAYREHRTRWSVRGEEGEEGATLLFAGAPHVGGLRKKSLVFGAVGGAVLFAALAYAVGTVSYEIAVQHHYADPSDPSGVIAPASVAAATPFHRERAVNLVTRALYPDSPGRAALATTAADLERSMGGSCTGLLRVLWRDGSVDVMPSVAERCGDDASLRLGARGALLAGDLDEAADLARRAPAVDMADPDLDSLWTDVLVYLLGGDLEGSATGLRAVAARTDDPERSAGYRCIADSLDIRASGEEDPDLEALQDGADGAGDGACASLLVDHFDISLRPVLHAVLDQDLDFRFEPLVDELAMESVTDITAPLAAPFDYPVDLAVGRTFHERAPVGLDAAAVEALGDRELGAGVRASRAAAASRLAGFLAATGDTDRALALLGEAERDLETVRAQQGDDFEWGRVLAWMPVRRAAVQVRAGDLDAARAELARADDQTARSEPAQELAAVVAYLDDGDTSALSDEWEPQLGVEGLRLATDSGDGKELVSWLRRHDRYVDLLVAQLVAGKIRSHPEAVRAWLYRDAPADQCPTMARCRLDRVASEAFTRAIAARALGDGELADRLEGRARALREALLRRDLAIPWALLGRLAPPEADPQSDTP